MHKEVTECQAKAKSLVDVIYGRNTTESDDGWYDQSARINTLRSGDPVSDYVGRPDIQWGIIIDELQSIVEQNAGSLALIGAEVIPQNQSGTGGTLTSEDLAVAA